MPNNYAKLRPMQRLPFGWLLGLLAIVVTSGCQSISTSPTDSASTTASSTRSYQAEGNESVADLRASFLARPDLSEALERLTDLEAQALQLAADEPLKLGSLGTAILDIYYGSLAGHYVLQRFYDHVENDDTAKLHATWVSRIQDSINADATGTADSPYPAVTAVEPIAYAQSYNLLPVGSIYRSNAEHPFALLMLAKPKQGNLRNLHFDLQTVFDTLTAKLDALRKEKRRARPQDESTGKNKVLKELEPITPFALMTYLARRSDTAAQAAIGAYLASHDEFDDATQWLQASSRGGNVLANNLLARVHWEQAESAKTDTQREEQMDRVMENYLHAIALGSADAAYALGVLYLNDHYGKDNRPAAEPLLQQAANSDHAGALMLLGHRAYNGASEQVDQDKAEQLFVRAAQTENPRAQRTYANFLLDRAQKNRTAHPELTNWLRANADKGDTQSMVILGNLSARGIGARQSNRKAVRWFEKAVDAANNDPDIINQVAWTLAVSDLPRLLRGKYAAEIMQSMMENNAAAQDKPEYLDTWAASFAAANDFPRAIELQNEALAKARALQKAAAGTDKAANFDDMVEELEKHLQEFNAGRVISEPVP